MPLYVMAIIAYILINTYIIWRSIHWARCFKSRNFTKTFTIIFCIIYGTAALLLPIAYFMPDGLLHINTQRIANYFEGILIYTASIYVIIDLIILALHITKLIKKPIFSNHIFLAIFGIGITSAILITCIYGFNHAKDIKVISYDAAISKECGDIDSMKIVLVADTHIGYCIGVDHIANMVKLINEQEPDLVLFAGDVFNNSMENISDPEGIRQQFKAIKSKYGVYMSWGNHDVEERLFAGFNVADIRLVTRTQEMFDFVDDCGFTVLDDGVMEVADSFYIIGRKDYERPGDGTSDRLDLDLLMEQVDDSSKPVFVIDHEPRFLQETADAGVDIMFSGHTHDGQFFPYNIVNRIVWENCSGMIKKDNMYSVVTSGVGIYGPYMRIGTDADISVVNVTFGK